MPRRRTPDVFPGLASLIEVALARPELGGIDDGAGRHVERLPELIGQTHRAAGGLRRGDAGEDARAVLRRGARHRGDQAGVVDQLPIIGEQPAGQTLAAYRGHHAGGLLAEILQDRGSVDAGVPASRRGRRRPEIPVRTSARPARPVLGSSGTSCGIALTR